MTVEIDEDKIIEVLGPGEVSEGDIVVFGRKAAGKWAKVYIVEVEPDSESDGEPQILKEVFGGFELQTSKKAVDE